MRTPLSGTSDITALDAFPSGEISLGNDDQAGSRQAVKKPLFPIKIFKLSYFKTKIEAL
jgi:hypothetical protein